jgi:hypothetical protein
VQCFVVLALHAIVLEPRSIQQNDLYNGVREVRLIIERHVVFNN